MKGIFCLNKRKGVKSQGKNPPWPSEKSHGSSALLHPPRVRGDAAPPLRVGDGSAHALRPDQPARGAAGTREARVGRREQGQRRSNNNFGAAIFFTNISFDILSQSHMHNKFHTLFFSFIVQVPLPYASFLQAVARVPRSAGARERPAQASSSGTRPSNK